VPDADGVEVATQESACRSLATLFERCHDPPLNALNVSPSVNATGLAAEPSQAPAA
jgi:hypothetical protein